jgi:hypothetical protein
MAFRGPNEIPGRPTSVLVPIWSDNEHPERKVAERRALAEWRRRHPRVTWWRRLFRRRSAGG